VPPCSSPVCGSKRSKLTSGWSTSAPRGSTSTWPLPSSTTSGDWETSSETTSFSSRRSVRRFSPLPVRTLRQLRWVTVARYQTHGWPLIGAVSGPLGPG
jgi:hypothetical protein